MAATETPITELTPVYTDPAVLQGKAVLVHDPTTGDGIVFDASKLDPSEKYQKPSTGIPKTDLAAGVQESLEKADTALQPVETAIEDNLASFDADGKVKDSGIPSTKIAEIESEVQTLGNSAGVAEGIADTISAGTPQEFVFRQSGGDGVNYMKRIKGKTLAWNQLVKHGNFENLNGWNYPSGGASVANNIVTINFEGQYQALWRNINVISGHKYYISIEAKPTQVSDLDFRFGVGGGGYFSGEGVMLGLFANSISSTTAFTRLSMVGTFTKNASDTQNSCIYLMKFGGAAQDVQIRNIYVVDLTLLYGSEIDGMTDAEILAKFEGEYPLSYYPYNAGTLISNDAEALETVGFNQWDEEWVNGDSSQASGTGNYVWSKNSIKVLPNTDYYDNCGLCLYFYDSNGTLISSIVPHEIGVFTTPQNCTYILFRTTLAYGKTYNHDICINLSDSSFNGQYEPYRKRTLNLGLNNIRVKSHNIWDEEWENGIYNPTSGAKESNPECIRSKNKIRILPNTTYYINKAGVNGVFGVFYYDENENFISSVTGSSVGTTVTTPSNATYMTFRCYSSYGTTYNNDICINVSSSFNGQYEPHGDITITGGLKSAGSVYDEIVGNKYVKRIKQVDMGELDYTKASYGFYSASIGSDVIYRSVANLLSSKFTTDYYGNITQGSYKVGINTAGILIVGGDDVSAATFKAAMSGVMLNYELATPIEYELAEPIPNAILVDSYGTEQAIFPTHEDGSPSAPFACDSNYSISVKNLVAKLNSINNS